MKIVFALLALSLFSLAHAQNSAKRWDARLAIGGGTYPYLQDNGGHFLQLSIFAPEYVETAYNGEVLYQTNNKKIKVGLAIAYTKVQQYHLSGFNWSGASDPAYLLATRKIAVLMPAFNYTYLLRKKSQVYSEVCLGTAIVKYETYKTGTAEHSVDPAFQCTFLGYRLGTKIGLFTEVGYGYKGILQLGVSGKF